MESIWKFILVNPDLLLTANIRTVLLGASYKERDAYLRRGATRSQQLPNNLMSEDTIIGRILLTT